MRQPWQDRVCFGPTGGGGGGNTVTQVQQIPAYEQGFSQSNQDLAASLGSQPYPVYKAPLISGFTPQQTAGMQMAGQAATAYQPDLNAAEGVALHTLGGSGGMGTLGAAAGINPANPGVVGQFMSPYIQDALAPQITALNTQIGQQHQNIAAGATGAGAFGDARQGAYDALADFYGNQSLAGLLGQGYNTAFQNAQNTVLGEQQNLGQIGAQQGQLGLNAGSLLGNLGGQQQSAGIAGANALFNAGGQQQTQQQQALNAAYQQFLNQVNWPFQMLNVRESALSNSPYNIANSTTLPQANMTAQSLGAGLNLAGLAGLFGSGGGGNAPFGGTAFPSPH